MTANTNTSKKSIAEIAQQMGITAWDKLNGKQVAAILELVGQSKITELQVEKIIEISKIFAPIAASTFEAAINISEKTNEMQKKLLDNHKDSARSAIDTLKALLNETIDEDRKIKIAQMITDISKSELDSIQKMNQSNNKFGEKFLVVIGSIFALGALAFAATR